MSFNKTMRQASQILAFILSATLALNAGTVVQVKVCDNGSGTGAYTCTFVSPVTAGNAVIILTPSYSNGAGSPAFTDSSSQTYTKDADYAIARRFTAASKFNSAAITSATITPSTSKSSACVIEISGITSFERASVSVSNATGTTWTANGITTTGTSDMLLGAAYTIATGTGSYTSSGSWATVADCPNLADGDDLYSQFQSAVAAGTYNAAGGSANISTFAVTLSYVNAAVAACKPTLMLLGVGRCG